MRIVSAAEAVLGQTGNFWMDASEEAYYQGEEPEWKLENMNFFASEWIEAKATARGLEKFLGELASLPNGTAWFWSPHWLNLFERVRIREIIQADRNAR